MTACDAYARTNSETYTLDLAFSWYVEDRVAIKPFATGWLRVSDWTSFGDRDESFSWRFGIALDCRLDAALF
ncbi:MAG: hypothetical protein R3D98_10355 [Candidatus Krumholzibacteriia bacterium]